MVYRVEPIRFTGEGAHAFTFNDDSGIRMIKRRCDRGIEAQGAWALESKHGV